MRAWIIFGGTILVILCVLQVPLLHNHFISDEYDWIRSARLSLEEGGWLQAFTKPVGVNFYRPIVTFSFQIDYSFFGYSEEGYRAHQTIFHFAFVLASSWMLFVLFRKRTLAFFSGFLLAVYPSHHEVVTWLAGRPDLYAALFTVFSVGSFGMFLRNRRWAWYAVSLFTSLLGYLSKESAFAIPLLLIGITPLFVSFKQRKKFLTTLALVVPFFVLVGCVLWVRSNILTDALGGYQVGGESASLGYSIDTINKPFVSWVSLVNWTYAMQHFNNHQVVQFLFKLFNGLQRFWWLLLLAFIGLLVIARRVGKIGFSFSELCFAFFWAFAAFIPAYGISAGINGSLQFSRLFFLSSIGYCLLLSSVITSNAKWIGLSLRKKLALSSPLIILCISLWILNVQPWKLASQKAEAMMNSVAAQKEAFIGEAEVIYVQRMAQDIFGAATFYANSISEPFVAVLGDKTIRVYHIGGVPYADSPLCAYQGEQEAYLNWHEARQAFVQEKKSLQNMQRGRGVMRKAQAWDFSDPSTINSWVLHNVAAVQEQQGVRLSILDANESWMETEISGFSDGAGIKTAAITYELTKEGSFGERALTLSWDDNGTFGGGRSIVTSVPNSRTGTINISLCRYLHWGFSEHITRIRLKPIAKGDIIITSILFK